MGAFAYVMPYLPADKTTYVCVDLVIPMGWVNFPQFFCMAYEMAADLENLSIVDPSSSLTKYGP